MLDSTCINYNWYQQFRRLGPGNERINQYCRLCITNFITEGP